MKVLVCGDSYATLDPEHSHWADIWSDSRGYNVDHEGFEGESHVNIITKTLQRRKISDYDLVIYHVTDFLRAQIDLQNDSYSKILDKTLSIYSDKNLTTKLNKVIFNTIFTSGTISLGTGEEQLITEPVNISPNNLDPTFPQDNVSKDNTFNLYSSICLYWLVQANFNSLLLLVEKCHSNDVPLILVTDPDMSPWVDPEFFPLDNYIFVTDSSVQGETELCDSSSNHLSLDQHTALSKQFENFIVDNDITITRGAKG